PAHSAAAPPHPRTPTKRRPQLRPQGARHPNYTTPPSQTPTTRVEGLTPSHHPSPVGVVNSRGRLRRHAPVARFLLSSFPLMRDVSHIIGIDDAPFVPSHRGNVLIVGAVFAGPRLEGVLSTRVRRDGSNATDAIATMIGRSQFARHARVVL